MHKYIITIIIAILFIQCNSTKTAVKDDRISAEEAVQLAKKVGNKAPNFTLENQVGKQIELSQLLKKGPVVLTWYRGGWCPYCNIALHDLQEYLPQIQANNATLVALSPELPDNSLNTAQKHNIEFEVLSDVGNIVAQKYGIVFQLDQKTGEKYQQAVGLHQHNGDTSNQLPLPATYIINTQGKISWAFVDANYKNRAKPKDIVEALQAL